MRCLNPKCEAENPSDANFCNKCASPLETSPTSSVGALSPIVAKLLPRLPHVLAVPLLEYAKESVPYVKLHRMCDAAELLARFAASVMLADLLRRGKGRFPREWDGIAGLLDVLAQHLKRPTFASWRVIIEAALKFYPKEREGSLCFVAEMPDFARSLVEELGANADDDKEKLIPCRNEAAHSGRMSDSRVQALLDAHRERFDGLFEACRFLGDYPLAARGTEPGLVKLMGTAIPASLVILSIAEKAAPGRLYLLSPDETDLLDISPLHTYQAVRVRKGSDSEFHEAQDPPNPVPQVYFRAEQELAYLEYVTFEAETPHGQDKTGALERFKELFRLDAWREEMERRAKARAAAQKYAFERLRDDLLRGFVGRGECIGKMRGALEAKREGGIVWMTGKAGSGKSALMVQFLELGKAGIRQPEKWITVFHFFRAQEGPSCSRHAFFENALASLLPALGVTEAIEDDPRMREHQFKRVLGDLARKEEEEGRPWPSRSKEEGRDAKPPFRRGILLFLDGLDELSQSDPGFPDFIRQARHAGVVWFCAGQPLKPLEDAFAASDQCLHVFPARAQREATEEEGKAGDEGEGGVPPMTENEIREYLKEECPPAVYDLMRRDAAQPVAEGPSGERDYVNPFLKALIKKSRGLPLYLYLVAKDIREGRLTFREGQEQTLPLGLRGYYDRLLERMSIGDLKAAMTPMVMRLAAAKAPLTAEALHAFLDDVPELRGEEGRELLDEALRFGHVMLRRATLPPCQGETAPRLGYTIYHDSFKDHLLSPETRTVERSRKAAKEAIERACIGWREFRENPGALEYCLRFGPEHQIEARRWDDLEGLLTDLEFIEAKCAAGMTHELSRDYASAADALPEAQEERLHRRRILKYMDDLIAYSRGELPSLDIIPSVRPWSDEEIEADSRRIIRTPARLDRVRAFSQFIASETDALLEFGRLPGFCVQHAYNYADSGPVGDAAGILVGSEKKNVLVLRAPRHRLKCNPHPALLRTLGSWGVQSVGATPDGRRAVCGGYNSLRVWDLESGRCLRTLEGHADHVKSVSVTPDGRRAVSGGDDKMLRVWDLEGGRCLRVQEGHTESIHSVSIALDGRWAVSGSDDKTLRVWDLERGCSLCELEGHSMGVQSISVTPDGRRAISGSVDETLRVWDLETGRCLWTLEGHTKWVRSVGVTPDGRWAVSGGDQKMRVWDLETGRCLRMLEGHTDDIWSVSVTPDGRRAVSGSVDNTLRVWDLETGGCLRTLNGHTNVVWSVSVTPDGRRAVSGSPDGTLRVWDLESGWCPRSLEGCTLDAKGVSVAPDGKRAVSGGDDKMLRVWDLEKGGCLRALEGHTDDIWGVSITPDGRRAISASDDKTLREWDLESGCCLRALEGHVRHVLSVTVTPDGRRAVSGSSDNTMRVWDLDTGFCLRTLEGNTDSIWGVSVTPDGRRVVSAGDIHNRPRVWDLDSGRCLNELAGHRADVQSAIVTPDGRRAVSGSVDKTLRVWDLRNGRCLRTLEGHTDYVRAVSVTPDGRSAVSAGHDETLRVWDLESGRCLAVCQFSDAACRLSRTAAGGELAAGMPEGVVLFRLLNLRMETPLATPTRIWLHAKENSDGIWDEDIRTACQWCGRRSPVADRTLDLIRSIVRSADLTPDQSLCLDLPAEAWDDPGLLSECPLCHKPLKFNPFIVDERDRERA